MDFDFQQPETLTAGEKAVAQIAWEIAQRHPKREVTLSDVVERLLDEGDQTKNVRSTTIHHMKAICLKTMLNSLRPKKSSTPVLVKRPGIGMGVKAVFYWEIKS